MQEAQELIIEALRDKPELPPEPAYRERSPKRKQGMKDTSPSRTRKISPARDRSPVGSSRWQSPGRKATERSAVTISPKVSRKFYHSDQRIQDRPMRQPQQSPVRRQQPSPVRRQQPSPVRQPRPQPIMVQPAAEPVVPRLRLIDSDEFMRRSQETTGTGMYI